MSELTRRDFSKSVALAGVGTALSASRVVGADNRVRVGFIGLGNRGDQVLDAFLEHKDAEVVAICDIWQPYLDFASKKIGTDPEAVKDYRKVLDDKTSTPSPSARPTTGTPPDHPGLRRPARTSTVEKPLSLCVVEGRKMVEAARKHNASRRSACMRRSDPLTSEAADMVRNGAIGQVTAARAFHVQNEFPKGIGNPTDESRRRASTGKPGSGRRRRFRTTRIAPSIASAGSTTTPAASSPTSASITST